MMKKYVVTALLASAAIAHAQNTAAPASSPAKKELVQKLMVLQQAGVENVARGLVEQPGAERRTVGGVVDGVRDVEPHAAGGHQRAVHAGHVDHLDDGGHAASLVAD